MSSCPGQTSAGRHPSCVFSVNTELLRHLTLVAPIEKLLLMTDVHQRTTVEPEYIEFATQDSAFLSMFKKDKET